MTSNVNVLCIFAEDRLKEEHSKWINTTAEGIAFVRRHPEYIAEYEKFQSLDKDVGDVDNVDEEVTCVDFRFHV